MTNSLDIWEVPRSPTNSRQKRPRLVHDHEHVYEQDHVVTPSLTEEGDDEEVQSKEHYVILTDSEVLHCFNCSEPLRAPVFQCANGHTACSSCSDNLNNICPTCRNPTGHIRCRAIEKILESLKISCPNSKYGCQETLSYSEKNQHEKACIHSPCSCPVPGCYVVASAKDLSLHFARRHRDSAEKFMYNEHFALSLDVRDRMVFLQEHDNGALFVLSNDVGHMGNVVYVSCICPNSSKERFKYKVLARCGGSCAIFFQGFTKNRQDEGGAVDDDEEAPSTGFLLIPSAFFSSCGQIKLKICICD